MKILEFLNFEIINFYFLDVEGCCYYLNDYKGVIVSLLWLKYYFSKLNCEWRIIIVFGYCIKLIFDEFFIEFYD